MKPGMTVDSSMRVEKIVMRVLVTGAYGLIGTAVLARLKRDGHEVVAAGRNIDEMQRRVPFTRKIEADFNRRHAPKIAARAA